MWENCLEQFLFCCWKQLTFGLKWLKREKKRIRIIDVKTSEKEFACLFSLLLFMGLLFFLLCSFKLKWIINVNLYSMNTQHGSSHRIDQYDDEKWAMRTHTRFSVQFNKINTSFKFHFFSFFIFIFSRINLYNCVLFLLSWIEGASECGERARATPSLSFFYYSLNIFNSGDTNNLLFFWFEWEKKYFFFIFIYSCQQVYKEY